MDPYEYQDLQADVWAQVRSPGQRGVPRAERALLIQINDGAGLSL